MGCDYTPEQHPAMEKGVARRKRGGGGRGQRGKTTTETSPEPQNCCLSNKEGRLGPTRKTKSFGRRKSMETKRGPEEITAPGDNPSSRINKTRCLARMVWQKKKSAVASQAQRGDKGARRGRGGHYEKGNDEGGKNVLDHHHTKRV